MSFKIGDPIIWKSQANGFMKEKHGTVLAIVPPNVPLVRIVHDKKHEGAKSIYDLYNIKHLDGAAFSRNHESYLIRVEQPGSRKPMVYWPRVCLLKIIIT